jgi:hypothetical protein
VRGWRRQRKRLSYCRSPRRRGTSSSLFVLAIDWVDGEWGEVSFRGGPCLRRELVGARDCPSSNTCSFAGHYDAVRADEHRGTAEAARLVAYQNGHISKRIRGFRCLLAMSHFDVFATNNADGEDHEACFGVRPTTSACGTEISSRRLPVPGGGKRIGHAVFSKRWIEPCDGVAELGVWPRRHGTELPVRFRKRHLRESV